MHTLQLAQVPPPCFDQTSVTHYTGPTRYINSANTRIVTQGTVPRVSSRVWNVGTAPVGSIIVLDGSLVPAILSQRACAPVDCPMSLSGRFGSAIVSSSSDGHSPLHTHTHIAGDTALLEHLKLNVETRSSR